MICKQFDLGRSRNMQNMKAMTMAVGQIERPARRDDGGGNISNL